MKKLLLISILTLSSITFPPVQAKVCELCQNDNFDNLLATHAKVVVDFYAPWCGPCKVMKPTFEALGKSAEMDDVLFITVNVDTFSALASKYGVQGIPHLKFFKNGKEVTSTTGSKSKTELKHLIKSKLS